MKIFDDPYKHLDIDEKTRKFLETKSSNDKKKRIVLASSLTFVLISVCIFKSMGWVTVEVFQFTISAFMGGFIGSTFTYLLNNQK